MFYLIEPIDIGGDRGPMYRVLYSETGFPTTVISAPYNNKDECYAFIQEHSRIADNSPSKGSLSRVLVEDAAKTRNMLKILIIMLGVSILEVIGLLLFLLR